MNTTPNALARVIYTTGKTFDGLTLSWPDTRWYLRTGSTERMIFTRDLDLLASLQDAAAFTIEHAGAKVDPDYLIGLNAVIARTELIRPGQLRAADTTTTIRSRQYQIPPITTAELQTLIEESTASQNHVLNAPRLFARLLQALPFEAGNRRTAAFAANGILFEQPIGLALAVPYDDDDPHLTNTLTYRIARLYATDANPEPLIELLANHGLHRLEER